MAALAVTAPAGCRPAAHPADLVLVGGTVLTLDARQPQAEALAVRGERIAAVGSREEIDELIGSGTEVIDLAGGTAIPGLIDSHAHFLDLGHSLQQLDLRGMRSWDEVVAAVAEAVAKASSGSWIEGRGWHQEKWDRPPEPAVEGLPLHDALSAVSPDNPVLLEHASGHAIFANARAMELAGIDASTPNPPGGEIVRRADGRPTGAFRENAMGLVERRQPPTSAELREWALAAARDALRKGITTFQDAGSTFAEIDLLRAMAEGGALPIRLWVMVREPNGALRARLADYRLVDAADHHLTVRAVKEYADGALGSHGAWLLEPYADMPDSVGFSVTPLADIEEAAHLALDLGFQLCVHAIGDRANREILDLYERVLGKKAGLDHRWRIEHAQHLHPDDVPRFARLGVIASMQAVHATSDGPWVPERLGPERAVQRSYLWRSLLDSGAVVANGTDAPIEDVDPIPNLYAAVTRRLPDGSNFAPGQRMTREEALRSYTLDAAYAAFQEKEKGSLEVGKLADVTVLSGNPLSVSAEEILQLQVRYTVVGGRIAYRK